MGKLEEVIVNSLGSPVSWVARLILLSSKNAKARVRLGQVYTMIRKCAHENNVSSVRKKYDIHPTVTLGLNTVLFGDGKISIGDHTYIGRNSFVLSNPAQARIIIGKYCAISHNVHIRTSSYRNTLHFKDALSYSPEWGDVIIDNYVWIGAHVLIKGGITIGENSVIGANSVVTRDIPPNTVYGGVPARLICHKSDYKEGTLNKKPNSEDSKGLT